MARLVNFCINSNSWINCHSKALISDEIQKPIGLDCMMACDRVARSRHMIYYWFGRHDQYVARTRSYYVTRLPDLSPVGLCVLLLIWVPDRYSTSETEKFLLYPGRNHHIRADRFGLGQGVCFIPGLGPDRATAKFPLG